MFVTITPTAAAALAQQAAQSPAAEAGGTQMGDIALFAPEFAMAGVALVAFVASAFGARQRVAWLASLVACAIALTITALTFANAGEPFFPKMYRVDAFSQLLKLGIVGCTFATIASSARLGSFRDHARVDVPIFYALTALGMMMLVSATELLTLYVALEFSAYGLYILAVLHRREADGSEAGAKYILFGAATSAISLYGISIIYGITGHVALSDITTYIATVGASPLLIVAVLLTAAGVLFKLAAFPFHAWAPDAYSRGPHQGVTFIGTASKIAAIGVLLRIVSLAVPGDALTATFDNPLILTLLVLSVLSMTFGNLAALVQTDLKRLLAYSTIAHAGYMLIGVASFQTATSQTGTAAALFYAITYAPIAFAAFTVIAILGRKGNNPTLTSLRGLYHRSPLLALTLLIAVFGLAGIPPTPGFAGKWFVFSAALETGRFWLVFVAAVTATVALYYYLQIVRAAFIRPSDQAPLTVSASEKATLIMTNLVIVALGVYPTPVWNACQNAARALLGP